MSPAVLALSAGDHESRPDHEDYSADGGRNFLTVMGLNAHADVSCLDPMIFRMRKRDKKRKDTENRDSEPHHK
jgi:hypothetical protein